jgi:hypothetical protein
MAMAMPIDNVMSKQAKKVFLDVCLGGYIFMQCIIEVKCLFYKAEAIPGDVRVTHTL